MNSSLPAAPLYCLSGRVVHGQGNGHTVNMPTANLPPSPGRALPPFGVYAARVRAEGGVYVGVTNVGLRPTLGGEQTPTVETYLLDFQGDLYGREISLELFAYLRPTRKMASLSEVKSQVEQDAARARALLHSIPE